jgi:hypothetical protein
MKDGEIAPAAEADCIELGKPPSKGFFDLIKAS